MKRTEAQRLGWSLWLMALAIAPALAVDAQTVRDDEYSLLQQGELLSVALTSDGFLMPAFQREAIGDTGSEIVWDVLREAGGTALCATGHQGRLVRVNDDGSSKTLADVDEAELTALVSLADGSVLAAAAPTGRIYRLAADDTLTTFTTLEGVSWVWRMEQSRDGIVWLATGAEGRLLRLDPGAKEPIAEEVARFKSVNLLDLWIDQEGRFGEPDDIFIAGQNPGWLYRYRPSTKKMEVVYNANAEEIRALTPMGQGLALALNTERAPTPAALNLTLRMSGGAVSAPESMSGGSGTPTPDAEQVQSLGKAFAASGGQYGPPRSELVLLDKMGFERKLWQAPERPIHDLALSPEGQLLAAAGDQGRLFEVREDGSFSVVCDLREDYLVRIRPDEKGYLLATGRNGVIFDMGRARATEATYLSRAIDGGSLVQWGKFYWRGDLAKGQSVKVAFRLGNDGDVASDFWDPWTKDQAIEDGEPVALPAGPARYLQYRVRLEQKAGDAQPVRMDYAEMFYIQPNAAPVITDIKIMDAPAPGQPPKPGGTPPAPGRDGATPGGAPGGASAAQAEGKSQSGGREDRSNTMNILVGWTAIDPNQDTLQFALYFKAHDEQVWKLINDELTINKLPLDIGGVADGRYRFKVIATDALSNAPGRELTGEMISQEVIIDNTAPRVTSKAAHVKGRTVTIELVLADDLSPLSTVKMDLDNGETRPLPPIDGLLDEPAERIEWKIEALEPGEHVATFSVTDQRGNTTVDKLVFMVDK